MQREVRIISREQLFDRAIFRLVETVFQHTRADGTLSEPVARLILDRGDSAAILLHDTTTDEVVLTEQFRVATHRCGPGWMMEIPAGIVDSDENAEQCARREAIEEIGFRLRELEQIAMIYPSPGGCSERICIYYAQGEAGDQVARGGGVAAEGEDLRLIRLPVAEAIERAFNRQIDDAKTLIAIQWLALARTRLR